MRVLKRRALQNIQNLLAGYLSFCNYRLLHGPFYSLIKKCEIYIKLVNLSTSVSDIPNMCINNETKKKQSFFFFLYEWICMTNYKHWNWVQPWYGVQATYQHLKKRRFTQRYNKMYDKHINNWGFTII